MQNSLIVAVICRTEEKSTFLRRSTLYRRQPMKIADKDADAEGRVGETTEVKG